MCKNNNKKTISNRRKRRLIQKRNRGKVQRDPKAKHNQRKNPRVVIDLGTKTNAIERVI